MDDYAGVLLGEAGAEDAFRVRYYHLDPAELARGLGCDGAPARCANDGWVYTDLAFNRHELVHATRQVVLGYPLPGARAIEEGLAELYDEDGDGYLADPSSLATIFSKPAEQPSRAEYATLQHFFSLLEEDHGLEPVVEFVDRSGGLHTFEDVALLFESVFGEELVSTSDTYLASYPVCSAFSSARHAYECQAEPRPWTGIGPVADLTIDRIDCESSIALGPFHYESTDYGYEYLTLDVTESDFYAVATPEGRDAEGSVVWMKSCEYHCSASPSSLDRVWAGNVNNQVWLEPGRYLFRLARPVTSPGFAGFEVLQSPL